jgi:hypothetical protein
MMYLENIHVKRKPCLIETWHSDDILGARMLWKPKEARILKKFIDQPV